jgi:hypothetical protein
VSEAHTSAQGTEQTSTSREAEKGGETRGSIQSERATFKVFNQGGVSMSQASEAAVETTQELPEEQATPNCLAISERGVRTAQDFAQFMSAMMGDVISGRLSSGKASAATRSGCALLKVIEMQYRYGSETEQPGKRVLRLID